MSGAQSTLLAARPGEEVNTTPAPAPPKKRKRRVYENEDFFRFVRRIIEAAAQRVAAGDVEALRDLVELEGVLKANYQTAVDGLRAQDYSWSEIASRLGVTKFAAWKRWGRTQ